MERNTNTKGQTLVETALILIVFLIILLGIVEFSRAWYMKNSLKNGVRHAVRMASVTPGITEAGPEACPGSNVITAAVCNSPGVKDASTQVSLRIIADGPSGLPGDEVTVTAEHNFDMVVGGGIFPWDKTVTLITNATMRHE